MGLFTGDQREWIDSLSPTLWFKLQLLSRGETWLLEDQEFTSLLEQLAYRISNEDKYLSSLILDKNFASLIQILTYMHVSLVLRLFSLSPDDVRIEATILQWCADNKENGLNTAACNVMISRFDWIIQQDLNNRIFGKYTRQRIKKILNSI